MDGPLELEASESLLFDVQDALSFWYGYGRHPYRSLSGFRRFMITTEDFRLADSTRYWRFTREQTEDMLQKLWPDDAPDILKVIRQNREGM